VQVRADRDGDGLVLVWPWGDVQPLVALADGAFRVGEDEASPERVRFRAVVEGRPAQAVVSGWPFDRVESTPAKSAKRELLPGTAAPRVIGTSTTPRSEGSP
jgi:hypothetical protein